MVSPVLVLVNDYPITGVQDPPHWALGLKNAPPGSDYRARLATGKTKDEARKALNDFLSGYFDYEREPVTDPSKFLIYESNHPRPPTISTMTPDEYNSSFSEYAEGHSENIILKGITTGLYGKTARRVLFNEGKDRDAGNPWPRLRISG